MESRRDLYKSRRDSDKSRRDLYKSRRDSKFSSYHLIIYHRSQHVIPPLTAFFSAVHQGRAVAEDGLRQLYQIEHSKAKCFTNHYYFRGFRAFETFSKVYETTIKIM